MRLLLSTAIVVTFFQPWLAPSNSEALTREGRARYGAGAVGEAVERFREAEARRPGGATTFNRGTAQIAGGEVDEGAAAMATAANDPRFTADAIYNRGNAALMREQWDAAIRDYEEVLRREPARPDAKRNLEIALRRKQAASDAAPQSGPQQPRPGSSQPQPQEPEQGEGDGGERRERTPDEEILRAIAEQERQELSRMRKQAAPARRAVGW